jgi:hypothetical protein
MHAKINEIYFDAMKNKNLDCEDQFYNFPQYAYLYAKNIIKRRLKDESVFLKDMCHAVLYAKDVIGGRLPEELEETFFNENSKCYYFSSKLNIESDVALDPFFYLLEYSKVIGRLPEKLHNYMILNSHQKSEHIKKYFFSIKN